MKQVFLTMTRPLVALFVALLLGAVVIAVAQKNAAAPLAAYRALLLGAGGDANAWANTLFRTMPLLLTGAAVAVAYQAGLFNIGAEGQMTVGALAAAVAGYKLAFLPAPLLLFAAVCAGMAMGAAWAFLPAYLKIKRGAHEVITAILLNYIAQNTTRYLANVPLRDPAGQVPQTPEVATAFAPLVPAHEVHWGLGVAVFAVLLLAFALRRTVWGYETRAVGQGSNAAEAAGINVGVVRVRAMMVSGGLAGLAGAVLVLGATPFHRFPADFYGQGYGFDGLAVALLAGNAPLAVLPSALLFGALGAGAEAMAFNTPTPKQIISAVEAILIIAVAARYAPQWKRPKAKAT